MRQPELVTINGGFQLCGVCGEMLLNGDTALFMADAYCHVSCEKHNVPEEWKVARRIDAYLATDPNKESPEYWENLLTGIEVGQRERQYPVRKFEDGEETSDAVSVTGQRWNGNVLADCRDFLNEMAAQCDRPTVARLMVEIATHEAITEERQEMYASMSQEELEADKHEVHHPFVDAGDERTSVGLHYVNGRLSDNLPTDEVYTDEHEDEQ